MHSEIARLLAAERLRGLHRKAEAARLVCAVRAHPAGSGRWIYRSRDRAPATAGPDETLSAREHPAKKGLAFNLLVTAVEVGGSIALFHLARRMGASDVIAYLSGSVAAVVGGVTVWAKARKFSGASAAIFVFTAVSALIALIGSTTPKVLLYKDCATTALIGLLFLGSCLVARKPIVFYFAQRYGTDGSHDGMAVFDAMWHAYPDFRRAMYLIGYLWAALFLIQAAGTALIIRQSSYSTGYTYDQILPIAAIALGILGSVAIGRYFAASGKALTRADTSGQAQIASAAHGAERV